jgi:hypothetical protein
MRDDDSIDGLGVDAGRSEIGQELAVRPLARIESRLAQAGVDDDELLSGIDDDRVVRSDVNVRFAVRRDKRRIDLLALDVGDHVVRQFETVHAIGHHGDLEAADLVAVPARRLRPGRRRGRARRPACGRRNHRDSRGRYTSGKQATAREFGHDVPS